jgi:head-tail adaptor
VRAGQLDRRVTIMRATQTQSQSGAPIQTWGVIVHERAARLVPVKGDEVRASPTVQAQQQCAFLIRYSANVADLTPRDRIVFPAISSSSPPGIIQDRDIYDVLDVELIGRKEGLKLVCQRRADSQ